MDANALSASFLDQTPVFLAAPFTGFFGKQKMHDDQRSIHTQHFRRKPWRSSVFAEDRRRG
jgi:hypothetical protein